MSSVMSRLQRRVLTSVRSVKGGQGAKSLRGSSSAIRGMSLFSEAQLAKHNADRLLVPEIDVKNRTPINQNALAQKSIKCARSCLESHPGSQMSVLPNGLRVVSEATQGETATVGLWIDTGSRYEDTQNNGVAHFLEHLIFKGTTRRTQVQLEKEIENMGGHLNAYTSRESTVFYAKVMKNDVGQAMDILGDIVQNSRLDAGAIERERDTVLREMEEIQNQTEEVTFDYLHETAFQKSSLSRTILGPPENIKTISREDIRRYIDTHYTAPRMVVCGAGALEHEQLVKLSSTHFGGIPSSPLAGHQVVKEPAIFTGSDMRVRYDDMPLAHVAFAFPTVGWAHPDSIPLMLLQTMIGSFDDRATGGEHSSSRLVAAVAGDNMARSFMCFNTQYSDTGLFGVYAVAEPKALDVLMSTVTRELVRVCHDLEPERFAEAQSQMIVNTLNILDGCTSVCESMGQQMLSYGRRIHPTEMIDRIAATTPQDVKNVASKFIYDRCFALAAVGPTYELPDYSVLRRRTYWNRF